MSPSRAGSALLLCALLSAGTLAAGAGPREFGMAELRRAERERGLAAVEIATAIRPGAAESYEIVGRTISGGDERGLMYGLLAAAEQIRSRGRLADERGAPRVALRGTRLFIHNAELERGWYFSREHWEAFFSMLARDRFNRFNLVFAHQTEYLAPPYPFWVEVPELPAVRARGLSGAERARNLAMLQTISQAAATHGIDFTLGIWEHDSPANRQPPGRSSSLPAVDGLSPENIGPYSYAALRKLLRSCPAITSVQLRTNAESGIPDERQLEFYGNHVFRALRDAGRPVTLDLRGWSLAEGMIAAAERSGVPLRLSAKFWAEHLGRPYQPAETYPNYSYLDLLAKPRRHRFYWELWGLGSHRLLLWGSPEYVRRAVASFALGDAEGFEIDPPLAQKGFGNAPGSWGIFSAGERRRVAWRWEFERYWLFYRLWGRLSYDPRAAERVWMEELERRFGAAAADVMAAYRNASEVLAEIVAVHLADPNMVIWPEINPGGPIDAYREAPPGDWRTVASIPEAVANRLDGVASAKQAAPETAARLDAIAERIDAAVRRAAAKTAVDRREWLSSEPDFRVLALLARYHACKQRAAYDLELFYETGDAAALRAARIELAHGLSLWESLAALTAGLYPEQMSFGPEDAGHWQDKLPYVRNDLAMVAESEELVRRYGPCGACFAFGGPIRLARRYGVDPTRAGRPRRGPLRGFAVVHAASRYRDARGFGWLDGGRREEVALPPTSSAEAQAVVREPANLPRGGLFHGAIRGEGAQRFVLRVKPGRFEALLLHEDGSSSRLRLRAAGERLEVPMPAGRWAVRGLIVKPETPAGPASLPPEPAVLPRPVMRHHPPAAAPAGEPLVLRIAVTGSANIRLVRLHYRPVNQLARWQTLEAPPGVPFTIPGRDVAARWDLMYYFEVIHRAGGGWFEPDPHTTTPYHVVRTVGRPGE
jgi:hypothetical protein